LIAEGDAACERLIPTIRDAMRLFLPPDEKKPK
jgi:hypothetical protein